MIKKLVLPLLKNNFGLHKKLYLRCFGMLLFQFCSINLVVAQVNVKMFEKKGILVVPCKVNNLQLNFIFDTGADIVSLSLTEALFMLKNGYLKESDFIETSKYQLANGDIQDGSVVNLRVIEIEGIKIYNTKATIIHKINAPLLLGKSAIRKLGKITIDYNENTLLIHKRSTPVQNNDLNNKKPINKNINERKQATGEVTF